MVQRMTVQTFEDVISAWTQHVCCELPTLQGGQCRRPAYWRVDLHGCEQALLCGQHLRSWLREVSANNVVAIPRCGLCGRIFDTAADGAAFTVVAL